MLEALGEARQNISTFAPHIYSLRINRQILEPIERAPFVDLPLAEKVSIRVEYLYPLVARIGNVNFVLLRIHCD